MTFQELNEKYPIQYVVMDNHTLGYLIPEVNQMGVLHGSVLKGSPYDWRNGSVMVSPSHNIRKATKKDFQDFRVMLPTDFVQGE